jgi:hypothetical protein
MVGGLNSAVRSMKVALRVEGVLSLLRMNQKITPSSVNNIMASNIGSHRRLVFQKKLL